MSKNNKKRRKNKDFTHILFEKGSVSKRRYAIAWSQLRDKYKNAQEEEIESVRRKLELKKQNNGIITRS